MFSGSGSTTPAASSGTVGGITGRRASRHLPYLLPLRNILAFRIRIPTALQPCLGRKEYRRSLGPSYANEAKIKSLRLAAAAHEVFTLARAVLKARSLSGDMYTTHPPSCEEIHVTQEKAKPEGVYTNLEGRELDTLTDEEIRAVADSWLLAALKGHDALMRRMVEMRRPQMRGLSPEQVHSENQRRTETSKRIR